MLFTHHGWFGLCPVHIGKPYSGALALKPRHVLLEWWMDLNEMALGFAGEAIQFFDEDYEPLWPIRITGKLDTPIEVPDP